MIEWGKRCKGQGAWGVEMCPSAPPLIPLQAPTRVMPTLPLLAGDLRFFALSPALPLWYINLPLFMSTINIEYLVKNKTDLVWDLAHI